MKDTVKLIIQSQSREEFKSFTKFLASSGSDRKDLQLAGKLRKGIDPAPEKNVNAYRLTKNRLKKNLETFALLHNIGRNHISDINSKLEMARYLSAKNLHLQAWEYLYKAETLARDNEEYELLNLIYYTQVSYYAYRYLPDDSRPDIELVLSKHDQNTRMATLDSNGNSAFALLTYELTKQLSTGFIDVNNTLVNKVLSRYNLTEQVYSSPKIYSRIVNIVCWALNEKKEYESLKQYAMSSYEQMVKKKMLDKVPHDFLMEFLSVLCLSLVKTFDFNTFEKFQQVYAKRVELFRLQKDKYVTYDFRGRIMKADLFLLTNNFSLAKKEFLMLEKIYGDNEQNIVIHFILRVNMMSMHFCDGNYEKSLRLFYELTRSNIQKKIINMAGLGVEIVIFTEIYAAIFSYELEEYDDASRQIINLKRRYAIALDQKTNKREHTFIQIFERMLNKSAYSKTNSFKNDCARFFKMKPFIPVDKEYISLSAWLLSKLESRSYYQALQKIIEQKQEPFELLFYSCLILFIA